MAGINLNPCAGEPGEIAKVALVLTSDEASFVNGTSVIADSILKLASINTKNINHNMD